jgi:hypothetical protein
MFQKFNATLHGFLKYLKTHYLLFLFGLLLSPIGMAQTKPAVFDENLCPASHQQFEAGLCYQNCKPSHYGFSTTCWQRCPEGMKDIGAFCSDLDIKAKNSYGRGAGFVLQCRPGTEQNGALCYPQCNSGYYGVGPVCWENTPSGWNDRGLHFDRWVQNGKTWQLQTRGKGSYGRGGGEALSSCPEGSERNGALCYPKCASSHYGNGPVCWERCPQGYTDDGATCRRDNGFAKNSYQRGVGVPRTSEIGASFTRSVAAPSKEDFYFVAMSDPQLAWDDTSAESIAAGGKLSQEALWRNAREHNLKMIRTINALNIGGKKPAFTSINGDLTAYFHEKEHAVFREYYDAGFPGANADALRGPVFLGLGNHDYENNVDGCRSYTTAGPISDIGDTNRCAKNAMNLIRGSIFLGYVKNFPREQIESFDAGSLAYSWNKGNWHFVQLNNGRTDKIRDQFYTNSAISISSPESWLREDLKRATSRGQQIIIFVHEALNDLKTDVFDNTNVLAMFSGHYHNVHGLYRSFTAKRNGQNFSIPIYLSGSVDYGTYLIGEIRNDVLTVTKATISGATAVIGTLNSNQGKINDANAAVASPVASPSKDDRCTRSYPGICTDRNGIRYSNPRTSITADGIEYLEILNFDDNGNPYWTISKTE